MSFIAIQDIKAGEPLTISYVRNSNKTSHFQLHFCYGFNCNCDICEENKRKGLIDDHDEDNN